MTAGAVAHDRRPDITVAVCTLVRGRTAHLQELLHGLDRQTRPADRISVAVMGGPDPTVAAAALGHLPITFTDASSSASALPLAAARNAARTAAGNADLLVFLDVDVIPSADLVADYCDRLTGGEAVWSGRVDYLPELPGSTPRDETELSALGAPHPARLPPATDRPLDRPELFWSLSFAISARTYDGVGGFDDDFVGYGGEDTDFALRLDHAGVPLMTTAAARGWHQHHDSQTPPRQHVADICRNAAVFRQRWGYWPMESWLMQFADEGLIDFDPAGSAPPTPIKPT